MDTTPDTIKQQLERRIAELENRLAMAEARIAGLESRGMVYGPITQPNPWQPPFTVTCKLADGTTKDITFTSPIVAQNGGIE